MGRYTFIIIFIGLVGLIAAIVPRDTKSQFSAVLDVPTDSTTLKMDTIFICKGHYFEWCLEESSCGYCNENLEKVDLWEYYRLLECEDCQKFFEENYYKFIDEPSKS